MSERFLSMRRVFVDLSVVYSCFFSSLRQCCHLAPNHHLVSSGSTHHDTLICLFIGTLIMRNSSLSVDVLVSSTSLESTSGRYCTSRLPAPTHGLYTGLSWVWLSNVEPDVLARCVLAIYISLVMRLRRGMEHVAQRLERGGEHEPQSSSLLRFLPHPSSVGRSRPGGRCAFCGQSRTSQ